MLRAILCRVQSVVHHGLGIARQAVSRWTKPIAHAPAFGTLVALARSKPQLIAENVLLLYCVETLSSTIDSTMRLLDSSRG